MVEAEVAQDGGCYVVFRGAPPKITFRQIMDAVCRHRGLTLSELVSPGRESFKARSRQMVMWLADRLRPDLSFSVIARMLGRGDHTTVIHGINRIDRLIASGCPHTIASLAQSSNRLGIEGVDMNAPREGRLSDFAIEERMRRKRKKQSWITPPYTTG